MRTIKEILDTAVKNIKLELKEKSKGRDKYIKRMRNKEKLKNKR